MSAAASARRRFARIRDVVIEFPVAPRPKVAQGEPAPPLLPPRATMAARPIPDAPLGDPGREWREPSRVLRAVMSDGWVEADGPGALRLMDAAALLDLHFSLAEWGALHPRHLGGRCDAVAPLARAPWHVWVEVVAVRYPGFCGGEPLRSIHRDELRAPASVIRDASDVDGKITYGEAFAAVIAFYTAKIDPAALDAALTPTRRGPRPGLYGTPLALRRLRTDAARAAAPLVDQIDRQTRRLSAVARAQAPEGPADARRVARLGQDLEGLAAALAKRNSRALRGLGPKEIKG